MNKHVINIRQNLQEVATFSSLHLQNKEKVTILSSCLLHYFNKYPTCAWQNKRHAQQGVELIPDAIGLHTLTRRESYENFSEKSHNSLKQGNRSIISVEFVFENSLDKLFVTTGCPCLTWPIASITFVPQDYNLLKETGKKLHCKFHRKVFYK